MVRRRQTPWIHRFSRLLIAAIAAAGAVETAFLTVVELTGSAEAVCPTSGCVQVLSSSYGKVFGLPLTLFGFLAYTGMGVLAAAPLAINPVNQKELRSKLEKQTWPLLFAGGTVMAIFSSYLLYLQIFEIKAFCPYCIASAVFSVSMFVLSLTGREWEDMGQLFFNGVIVGMVTLVGTLGLYASAKQPVATAGATTAASAPGQAGQPITTTSGEAEMALARHLREIGAKMYGAFWCVHCHDQKLLFGKEALESLDYVECDPKGKNPRPQMCAEAKIQGYPTWEIKGEKYPGVYSLQKLGDLSGYNGPSNFKNLIPGAGAQ